jgi:DNA-binding CsgD family transcriptional regulator
MRSLFDLTPSEARVARGLAVGETLKGIASAGGVAISTVRSQLRQVLEKTGCARQAELMSLLANVTLDRSATEYESVDSLARRQTRIDASLANARWLTESLPYRGAAPLSAA